MIYLKNIILIVNILNIIHSFTILTFIKSKVSNILKKRIDNENLNLNKNISYILNDKYNLNWHVIEESKNIKLNTLYKITLLNKDYVIWKNNNSYYAMDNDCSHRGALLSKGKLINNNVVCPYHEAEFNSNGKLCKIPGINNFNNSLSCYNQDIYNIIEKNGWIFLNTISKKLYNPLINLTDIYESFEENNMNYSSIYTNSIINANNRLVSENLLDVMHISYVHSFGNRENPLPINEPLPILMKDYPYHYKIIYFYISGKNSLVNRLFMFDQLIIENEFILPHTVISRVRFGSNMKTIITFASPINNSTTRLFIKVYRNYWYTTNRSFLGYLYNIIGNNAMTSVLQTTIDEDIDILESINEKHMDGKFNMKYDKFPYMYRKLYNKVVNPE